MTSHSVLTQPPGVMHGVETKFQLYERGQFVMLESMRERGRHVGVLPTGQIKPALATGKEEHAMFGVRILVRPKLLLSCFSLSNCSIELLQPKSFNLAV